MTQEQRSTSTKPHHKLITNVTSQLADTRFCKNLHSFRGLFFFTEMRIHLSEEAQSALSSLGGYVIKPRGMTEIKVIIRDITSYWHSRRLLIWLCKFVLSCIFGTCSSICNFWWFSGQRNHNDVLAWRKGRVVIRTSGQACTSLKSDLA